MPSHASRNSLWIFLAVLVLIFIGLFASQQSGLLSGSYPPPRLRFVVERDVPVPASAQAQAESMGMEVLNASTVECLRLMGSKGTSECVLVGMEFTLTEVVQGAEQPAPNRDVSVMLWSDQKGFLGTWDLLSQDEGRYSFEFSRGYMVFSVLGRNLLASNGGSTGGSGTGSGTGTGNQADDDDEGEGSGTDTGNDVYVEEEEVEVAADEQILVVIVEELSDDDGEVDTSGELEQNTDVIDEDYNGKGGFNDAKVEVPGGDENELESGTTRKSDEVIDQYQR